MFKQVSFYIAGRDSGQRFTHFIAPDGIIATVAKGKDCAKVCVIADTPNAINDDQRSAILNLAEMATLANVDVSLTFGRGLSPYRRPTIDG